MNKTIKLLLSFLFVFALGTVSAQKMKIQGTVYDTTGTRPIPQALAMAVRMKDSVLLGFTRTNFEGKFELKTFDVDTFTLIISTPGYDDKSYYIFGSANNDEIEIPSVKMQGKSQELEEVVIYANKNPIYYKGDTLVYVADSFKVAEGAVVEDLLKRLPGISVDKDGKITSQGQEINKVLVDGDEFFGSDPTIATKNLGADGIETVQVYEKTDDETIGGSDEKIKVLDLRLKEDAKKGYFGRVSGASDLALTPLDDNYFGTRPFYEGELLLNKFNSKQKISVFALGSNTPRSNFGRGDLNKFGLSNEANSGRNFWESGNTNNTSGVPQTFKAGVYYSDKFGKKKNTEILFNYSYYNDQLDARSASESQYFLSDTTYFTGDSTRNFSKSETHSLNFTLSSQIDSLTLIEFRPSLRLDKGISESSDITAFRGQDGVQSLATEVNNDNNSTGTTYSGMARMYRKFKKKRRELEVRYDINGVINETEGFLFTRNDYTSLGFVDTIDQKKLNNNSNMTHYGTVSYFEPLSKKLRLNFNYLYEYGISNQDKRTFDAQSGNYTVYRTDLSNNFDNLRTQHRAGTELIYENSKHTVAGGFFVRNINIDNINKVTDSVVNQNISNFLPKFRYEFKPSMSKRFSVNYNTSSQQPSINDLQPVLDNTNPNRIQIGNPDLKPNYVHNVMVNFNQWNALSGKYFWSGASFNVTQNAFANQTDFDQYGRTTSKTVNVDGNMGAFLWMGAGIPILNRKIEFNPSLNGSYNHYKNFIGTQENITDNFAITPELDIDFTWDSLEINLSGSYSYNNPVSSLSTVSNTPFSIENYSAGFEWRLKKGFGIEVEGEYTRNSQPGGGFYNTDFFVLNAEVNKKFLKTQNLVVSIVGNDILNQNINARREVNGNTITDYRTTIISRYFLLKATMRFNNRKTKEEDFRGWH
jgi:hypothetical protein